MNPMDPSGFRLLRFNPRRAVRGCAEVEVCWSDGDVANLWMTQRDVELNIIEFGRDPGLVAALEAYRVGVEITWEQAAAAGSPRSQL